MDEFNKKHFRYWDPFNQVMKYLANPKEENFTRNEAGFFEGYAKTIAGENAPVLMIGFAKGENIIYENDLIVVPGGFGIVKIGAGCMYVEWQGKPVEERATYLYELSPEECTITGNIFENREHYNEVLSRITKETD